MDRKTNLIPALLLSALSLYAMEDVKVTQFQHAGPFTVNKPILADSLNVNGKPFEAKNLLKATLPFEQTLANATVLDADTAGAILRCPAKRICPASILFLLEQRPIRKRHARYIGSRGVRSIRQ
mgnify:CR=1 FL=1